MKKITLMLLLVLSAFMLHAQKTIRELADLPDKKLDKLIATDNYASQVKSFAKNYQKQTGKTLPDPLVPQLKRVGLLTFFTADHSEANVKAMKNGGTYQDFLTEAGGFKLVTKFYEQSLPELRAAFQAQGMELLIPEEYITTEEQAQVYNSYEIEVSKLASATLKAANYLTKQWDKSYVAVDNYRVFAEPTVINGMDMKVTRSMGPLAEQLGVDALLTVQILTSKEKTDVGLNAVRMALHSPNPVPDDPAINYGLGFYYEGILVEYAGMEFEKPIIFAQLPKKANKFQNYQMEGFDVVTRRLISKLLGNIQTDYAGK